MTPKETAKVHCTGTNGRAVCGLKFNEHTYFTPFVIHTNCQNCLNRLLQDKSVCNGLFWLCREYMSLLDKSRAKSNFSTVEWNKIKTLIDNNPDYKLLLG